MEYTAAKLLEGIRNAGGRVHRSREPGMVYVLTTDERVAERLLGLGGKPYRTAGEDEPIGSYLRAPDTREWDIVVSTIPIVGEQSWWEAAG